MAKKMNVDKKIAETESQQKNSHWCLPLVCSWATLLVTGCAMCCGPYDYHYPNYGGSVQRSDPVWGRVGSIYSDPGPFGGPAADYNLKPHDANQPSRDTIDDGGLDIDTGPLESVDEGSGSNSDILPPPRRNQDERPGPDDSTSIRRLRNQSLRGQRRWR